MPSCRSAVASVSGWAIASHCRPLSKSACPPSARASFVSRLAIGAVAATASAVAWISARNDVGLDDPRDQPRRSASSASTVRPVSSRSRACAAPTTFGSRKVPAMPACMPSFTNGTPSFAPDGGVPDVAGEREAQPGADRGPVDGGDRRHLEPADRQPGPVERQHPLPQLVDRGVGLAGDPGGVAAGAERRPLARSPRPPGPSGRRRARRPPPPTTRSSGRTSRCAGRGCRG